MAKKKKAVYRELIEAAKEASKLAYRPYSHYPVGAAVLTFDGEIYTGCNVENCGYTQTIHAEQNAMARAISEGALVRALEAGRTQLDFIDAVAVYAPKGTDPWPCCNCRQSLNEFGLEMKIVGEGPQGKFRKKKLEELIPHAFPMEVVLAAVYGKDWKTKAQKALKAQMNLLAGADSPNGKKVPGRRKAIMTEVPTPSGGDSDQRRLVDAAKRASLNAYCPYSKYPVGAAILTYDGVIYTGCNIENCGYTQTIHAEQVAMAKSIADGALRRALADGLSQFEFIKAIAVYSPKGSPPWPSCNGRQSLNEFGLSMDVIGIDNRGKIVSKKLEELIPFAFPMDVVLESVHGKDWRRELRKQLLET